MEDFDYTDAAEATIRLEIEGEETLVHHAQHVSKADQQAVAELVAEKSREFSPEGFSHDTDWMEDNLPSLAMEIYGMISTQFSDLLWEADIEALDEFDYAEVHLLPFFSYEEGAWETSQYDTENYLNQGESPAVHGGRESDTPRHKPRSTLIQGYPL